MRTPRRRQGTPGALTTPSSRRPPPPPWQAAGRPRGPPRPPPAAPLPAAWRGWRRRGREPGSACGRRCRCRSAGRCAELGPGVRLGCAAAAAAMSRHKRYMHPPNVHAPWAGRAIREAASWQHTSRGRRGPGRAVCPAHLTRSTQYLKRPYMSMRTACRLAPAQPPPAERVRSHLQGVGMRRGRRGPGTWWVLAGSSRPQAPTKKCPPRRA